MLAAQAERGDVPAAAAALIAQRATVNIARISELETVLDHDLLAFVNAVAEIAHAQDHHPDMMVGYNACTVSYSTHSRGGLTLNDAICAAQFATPEQINFMATEARGLICLAMEGERLDALDLPLMVDELRSSYPQVAINVVEAAGENAAVLNALSDYCVASNRCAVEVVTVAVRRWCRFRRHYCLPSAVRPAGQAPDDRTAHHSDYAGCSGSRAGCGH